MLNDLGEFYKRHNGGRPTSKAEVQEIIIKSVQTNRASTERAKNPSGEVRVKGLSVLQKSIMDTNKTLSGLRITTARDMKALDQHIVNNGRSVTRELKALRKAIDTGHKAKPAKTVTRPEKVRDTYKKVRDTHVGKQTKTPRASTSTTLHHSMYQPRDAMGRFIERPVPGQARPSLLGMAGDLVGDLALSALGFGKKVILGTSSLLWNIVKGAGSLLWRAGAAVVDAAVVAGTVVVDAAVVAGTAVVDAVVVAGTVVIETAIAAGTAAMEGIAAAVTAIGETALAAGGTLATGAVAMGEAILAFLTGPVGIALLVAAAGTAVYAAYKNGMFDGLGDKISKGYNKTLDYFGLGSHDKEDEKAKDIGAKSLQDKTSDSYASTVKDMAAQSLGLIEDKTLATSKSLLESFKEVKKVEDEKDAKDKLVKALDPAKKAAAIAKAAATAQGVNQSPGGGPGRGDQSPGGGNPSSSNPPSNTPSTGKPAAPQIKSDGATILPDTPDAPKGALAASLAASDPNKKWSPGVAVGDPNDNKSKAKNPDPASLALSGKPDSTPKTFTPSYPDMHPKSVLFNKPNPTTTANPLATSASVTGSTPASKLSSTAKAITDAAGQITQVGKLITTDSLAMTKAKTDSSKSKPDAAVSNKAKADSGDDSDASDDSDNSKSGTAKQTSSGSSTPKVNDYNAGAVPKVNDYNAGAVPKVSNDSEDTAPPPLPEKTTVNPTPSSVSTASYSEPTINDIPQNTNDPALRFLQTTDVH